MRKSLRFIANYWYIPFLFLLFLLGWIFFRKRGAPLEQIETELEAIWAGQKVREMREKEGAVRARLEVLAKYANEREQLSREQQEKAEKLKDDPVALSKFLVRAGSR